MNYEYIQKEKNMEKLHWKHFIIYRKKYYPQAKKLMGSSLLNKSLIIWIIIQG